MDKKIKITVIGAGSSYTPELIEGLIERRSELPISEIVFHDIEDQNGLVKVNIILNLSKRMVKKYNLDWKISLELDRKKAIKGSDFIMTQIRVGALQARAKDERIPLKHGAIGQETNGVGGLFKLMRTLPVMIKIANEISELAPEAWMLNFTNPAGMITEGLLKYSNHDKIIGLCNVPIAMQGMAAELTNNKEEDIFTIMAGLNHWVFMLEAEFNGKNILPEIIDGFSLGNDKSMKNIKDLNFEPSFIKKLGVVPCPYHKYYFNKKEILDSYLEDFKGNETRAEVVQKLENTLFEKYKDVNLNIKPPELAERGGARYSEIATELVSQIWNDKKTYQVVNTQNRGTIIDLPYDSAIEVTSIITKNGPKPINIGHLPIQIRGITQALKAYEILAVDAVVEKDSEKAFMAICLNPLTDDQNKMRIIFDELMIAHKEYLDFD